MRWPLFPRLQAAWHRILEVAEAEARKVMSCPTSGCVDMPGAVKFLRCHLCVPPVRSLKWPLVLPPKDS